MSSNFSAKSRFSLDGLGGDLDNIEEVSERVRLAELAMAVPLADMRQGQMDREAARAAARFGESDPEARSRAADAQSARMRFDGLRVELVRARVMPATPEEGASAISGVVTRGGQPVAGATVSAFAGDRRLEFTCTNAAGGFSLAVPADLPVGLSVSFKDEGELFRDRQGMTLRPGQSLFRHIELDGAAAPCPPPPAEPPPTDSTFPMIRLIGQIEADARRLVAAQGLVLGERSEKEDRDQAGRVIDQAPAEGAQVRAGDSVSIVVATDGAVDVPLLLGLTREDARLTLAKAELDEGKISRKEAPPELEGRVTAQSPEAGARAARRSAVDLEIGIPKGGTAQPRPNEDVSRVASLAAHRLAERTPETGDEDEAALEARLAGAKVRRLADLDKLLAGDRAEARDRLGLRTLAETDRLLSALGRARKDLDG